jgi:hypothetical protein
MKKKTIVIGLGLLALGYWWMSDPNGLYGMKSSETTFPDTNQPNMKTKVPAGANNDHVWLVKG